MTQLHVPLCVLVFGAAIVAAAANTVSVHGAEANSSTLVAASKPSSYLVTSNGYPAREYTATTQDGFQLNLLRIPRASPKGVVFLQHGLMDSSDTWLLNGPGVSLGFLLYDAGYDVFLGNSRGNQYSPPPGDDYNWNFDQMAQYDIPAFLSAISQISGSASPIYIGHSQGTAILFAALSTGWVNPEDVAAFIALAPPVSLAHQKSILFQAMADLGVDVLLKLLGSTAFVPTLQLVNKILGQDYTNEYQLLSALFGPSDNLGDSNWEGHFPAPTSAQNVAHWVQEARYGVFMHYKSSIFHSVQPYHIADIAQAAIPVAVYYGSNDYMADPTDVRNLAAQLEQLQDLVYEREISGYGHMDFTWAPDAAQQLYPDVLDKVAVYANQTLAL